MVTTMAAKTAGFAPLDNEPATVTATTATSTLVANSVSTLAEQFEASAMTSAARPLVGLDDVTNDDDTTDDIDDIENNDQNTISDRETDEAQPARVI